jgi:hypothetical protein
MAARNRKPIRSWEMDDAKREPPRTCPVSGKRMYASEREARATASHRMADTQTGPARLRTYKCIYCNAWHLTSKEA